MSYARPIPMAEQYNAYVSGHLFVGIMGSNPARVTDVCLLWMFCVVR